MAHKRTEARGTWNATPREKDAHCDRVGFILEMLRVDMAQLINIINLKQQKR